LSDIHLCSLMITAPCDVPPCCSALAVPREALAAQSQPPTAVPIWTVQFDSVCIARVETVMQRFRRPRCLLFEGNYSLVRWLGTVNPVPPESSQEHVFGLQWKSERYLDETHGPRARKRTRRQDPAGNLHGFVKSQNRFLVPLVRRCGRPTK
jgi:hypothetical protein